MASSPNDHHEEHIHMPDPSIWPFVISLGSAVLLAGLTLSLPLLVVGLLILLTGVGGWIYEDIDLERGSDQH